MSLKIKYYKGLISQTKRGNYRGKVINAKPVLVLAVLDLMDNGLVTDNKFFPNEEFIKIYKNTYLRYVQDSTSKSITPFFKPYYYLQTDGYWEINWKNSNNKLFDRSIKENALYASLDSGLWDILQNSETRSCFRNLILKQFFNTKMNE